MNFIFSFIRSIKNHFVILKTLKKIIFENKINFKNLNNSLSSKKYVFKG